jgi:uncharacterized membrane protein
MKQQTKQVIGIAVFTLLYPAMAYIVKYIPNPMVPGAIVALNMILPVLAGYFYGPLSGAVTGGVGTALSALLRASLFDGTAIFPHILMGAAAGWMGKSRAEILSSTTILIGHILNMLFFLRLGVITIPPDRVASTLLGLATETMIDIVAIVLVIALLKRWLYQEHRW